MNDFEKRMRGLYGVSAETYADSERALAKVAPIFEKIEARGAYHRLRVLRAFQEAKFTESGFFGTTGYGYGDEGRDRIEEVYRLIFKSEKALVRQHFSSGTHVLVTCLRGLLRPGDDILCVSGPVYDTLKPTMMPTDEADHGALRDFNISSRYVDLAADGGPDMAAIRAAVQKNTKILYIQKSRGYTMRRAWLKRDIERIIDLAAKLPQKPIVMVDNCYGEFVEDEEPTAYGADLVAGSLIKNPGGSIAPTGAYIAGRADLLDRIAEMMTAPGVGDHVGPTLGLNRIIAQGFFFAPRIVEESLKSAVHAACLFADAGYRVEPLWDDERGDIVQIIELLDPDKLIGFCEMIQAAAPIDHFFAPVPAPMPGYDCDIIMASGSFIQGSSIELSADGPLRDPYAVFLQGGVSFESGRLGSMLALDKIRRQ